MAQQVKNLPAMRETWVRSLGWEDPLEKRRATPIPGLGRSPGEGKGYPLQYPGLENSMDTVHWVAKNWTQLSEFNFTSDHNLPHERENG